MQAGIHALGWSVQRLLVVVGFVAFGIVFAYSLLVFAIVVGQAVTSFGQ